MSKVRSSLSGTSILILILVVDLKTLFSCSKLIFFYETNMAPLQPSYMKGFHGSNSVRTEASAYHGKCLVRTQTALS